MKHCTLFIASLMSMSGLAQAEPSFHVDMFSQKTLKSGATIDIAHPTDASGCPWQYQELSWWSKLPWNGNDAPYALARRQIDAAVAHGTQPRTLLAKYQTQRQAQPWNALAIYRWGYAANLTRLRQAKTRQEGEALRMPVSNAIAQTKFPGSYQYARLAFISLAFNRPAIWLKDVGDRLLRRNPHDEDVKFWISRCLIQKGNTPDDKRGFDYIHWF